MKTNSYQDVVSNPFRTTVINVVSIEEEKVIIALQTFFDGQPGMSTQALGVSRETATAIAKLLCKMMEEEP